MDSVIMMLNQNRVVWGVSMLLLNIGSRYVIADLGKSHEYILSNQVVKKLVVMSMFFVATRDVLTSFLLTVAYVLIVDGILHEKRPYCLLPKKIIHNVTAVKNVSPEEYERAKKIVQLVEKPGATDIDSQIVDKKKEYINYLTNIAILKSNG